MASEEQAIRNHLALLDSRPFFDVECCGECNLRCTVCPRHRFSRPLGLMDPGLFESLRLWLPVSSRVVFSGLGEPLLHPGLAGFVGALKEGGHTVGLTTNAALLTPPRIEDLIEAGLDVLYASIPCTDTGEYAKRTGGPGLDRVLDNLRCWSGRKPPSTVTYLTSVLHGDDDPEVDGLRGLARKLGFKPHFRPLHSRGGSLYTPERIPAAGCGIFAKVSFIAWNGDVLACCNDTAGDTKLGNVTTHDFGEVLEEKKGRILHGDWFDVCSVCDDAFRAGLLRDGALEALDRLEGE